MRLQPPKTRKIYLTSLEFKVYILKHVVVGAGAPIPLPIFLADVCKIHGKHKGLNMFLEMFPIEYQIIVKPILEELIEIKAIENVR